MIKNYPLTICAILLSGLSFGQFTTKSSIPQPYEFNPPSSANVLSNSRAVKQRFDSTVYFSDVGAAQLMRTSKEEFIYDANYRHETTNRYNYVNNSWKQISELLLTYDVAGNITAMVTRIYNSSTSTWENNRKESYTYDANNFSTRYALSNWVNGSWVESVKSIYTPHANGMVDEIVKLSRTSASQPWDSTYHFTYSYDNSKNLIERITYRYNNGSWIESQKIENVFNSSNLKTKAQSFTWSSQWDLKTEFNYTLDANDNITFAQQDKWVNNQWSPYLRYNNDFDLSVPYNELIVPYWYQENDLWENQAIELMLGGNWKLVDSLNYYYSPQTVSSVNELEVMQINVYPNPVTDLVSFELPNVANNTAIEVYDMKGMLVISKRFNGGTLDVSSLKKGVYYFLITDEVTTYTGKLMKL